MNKLSVFALMLICRRALRQVALVYVRRLMRTRKLDAPGVRHLGNLYRTRGTAGGRIGQFLVG